MEKNMRKTFPALLIAAFAIIFLVPSRVAGQEQDIKGSKDHPVVTRMPGYFIDRYEVEEFAAFDPTVVGGKEVHWEGKKYSISYSRKEGATTSMLQIIRNYEAAVKQAGGKILGGDERRVAAEIRKGGAVTGVYVEAFNEGRNYQLDIVESQPMQQEVKADAAAMGRELAATGKTIVYGIYFDTDSATIKPQSEPSLDQMVRLLKTNASLKAYVIGHTDNAGTLEHNLKLSSDRAQAVVKAVTAKGIAASRLKSAGVGPYCPVATNRDERGRAANRRVELIEQ
jgi:outer membrane protein OmpA-like peptidoglycan-associated protein